MEKHGIRVTLNGEKRTFSVPAQRTLLELLREDAGLTGTKAGCEEGACGSCTVLLDGMPVLSCLTLAVEAGGCSVQTVEGLAMGAELHPLQETFRAEGALQCGYCTPGFLTASAALLQGGAPPDGEKIREALGGHLCRCTGYAPIVAAVGKASARGREKP